ncbi:Hint domain-containing protein [Tropicibacter sp. Alg240-R139]|uniref:Hint domain-containing protein n=1 Tax=Tropicibacter sp. Alg240-R139 TaxID=2305991 RepID=UPI0013DF956C|nr:Hint domain-containing protein [Tropicibacter sp. Alg240-R139]
MPTNYLDQFFFIDPANPPSVGSALVFQQLTLTDQNDDDDLDRFNGDAINGVDITRSWPGDTVTVNVQGQGDITYTGITFYLADGSRVFTPTDGQVLQNGTFQGSTFVNSQGALDVDDLGPICFTPGTKILTPQGERKIDALQVGDLVTTRDNGDQPILWIGRTTVEGHGDLAPIRFKAGVLGAKRPLIVSPQHRMVVDDWRAAYLFGHKEVLIAARSLVNGDTVKQVKRDQIDYIHLLLAEHEVLFANGVASESYFPGHALTRSDRAAQAEILTLFPELDRVAVLQKKTVLPVVRARDARMLAI